MRFARGSLAWPLAAVTAVTALVASLLLGQPWRTAAGEAPLSDRLGPSTLHWSSCSKELWCATLRVPVDYADPGGYDVPLRLMMLPAADPSARIGSIVTNPGGPGASGLAFLARAWSRFPSQLRKEFDIVTFDPRGVGRSVAPDCAPTHDALLSAPDSCSAKLYAHLGTADVARDMDGIRIALGERRLNYLGFSYGTVIGAVYANAFPKGVRAFVLDGALDPSLDAQAVLTGQARGFQREMDRVLASCAIDSGCPFYSDGQPRVRLNDLFAAENASERLAIKLGIMYWLYLDTAGREELLAALGRWSDSGDPSAVEELTGGAGVGASDVFSAVWCEDFVQPPDTARTEALLDATSQDFGEVFAEELSVCDASIGRQKALGPILASGAPPIVVIGSTGDPATPYEWSQSLAKELSSGVLLTRDGSGHTAYFFSHCIEDAVDAYFESGKPPDAGMACS